MPRDLRDRWCGPSTSLPPKLRAVVVLRDVYELSHEAIAEELGICVTAAKVRLHRARHKLRSELFPELDQVQRRDGVTSSGGRSPTWPTARWCCPRAGRAHVEQCLRCQAELVQHRRVLRAMRSLRHEVLEPAPGLLPDLLAALEEAGSAMRSAPCSTATGRPTSAGWRRPPRRVRPAQSSSPPDRAGPVCSPDSRVGGAGSNLAPGRSASRLALHANRVVGGWHRAVAQLVEHRSPKPAVGGSSPSCPAVPGFRRCRARGARRSPVGQLGRTGGPTSPGPSERSRTWR